jgi:hypothetical protein
MSLRAEFSTRFGWRYWLLQNGRLAAPYWGTILGRSLFIDAKCQHGNRPPSSECPCGVHYVPDVDRFWDGLVTNPPVCYPASYGVAAGPVVDDLYAAVWPGSVGVVRAPRYRVLALAVPEKYVSAAERERLSEFYRVAVVPDISATTLRGIVEAVDAGLDGFGVEVLDRIVSKPLESHRPRQLRPS